jgi:hypothetical protein
MPSTKRKHQEEPNWVKEMNSLFVNKMNEVHSLVNESIAAQRKIMEKLDELKERIDALEENGRSIATPSQEIEPDSISEPIVVKGKSEKDYIQDLLKTEFPEETKEELQTMFDILDSSVKHACQEYSLRTENDSNITNGTKMWKEINGNTKLTLFRVMIENAVKENHKLSFIYRCVHLWPCEYLCQPRWSNMSNYRRRKR